MNTSADSEVVANDVEIPLVDDNIKEKVNEETPSTRGKFFTIANKIRASPTFTLSVVLLAVFVDGAFYSIVIPLLPDYKEELKVSQIKIGFLYAIFSIVGLIGAPIVGVISDRIGRRIPMLVGLAIQILSTILFAYSNSYWLLLFARAFQGFGSVSTWTAGAASIGDLFPSKEQGGAYAKVLAATGSMAGPILGGALTQASGGRKDIPFLVILSLVIIDGICRLIMKEPKKENIPGEKRGSGYSQLLRDIKLVMTALIGGIGQLMLGGIESALPTYYREKFNLSSLGIGLFYGGNLFIYCIGTVIAGKLTDKYVNRRYEQMAFGLGAVSVLLLISSFIKPMIPQMIIIIISAHFYAYIYAPQIPVVNDIIETKHQGKYLGAGSAINNISWNLGSVLGPIVVSAIVEYFGFLKAILSTSIFLLLFTGLFCFLTLRKSTEYKPLTSETELENTTEIKR